MTPLNIMNDSGTGVWFITLSREMDTGMICASRLRVRANHLPEGKEASGKKKASETYDARVQDRVKQHLSYRKASALFRETDRTGE